MTHDCSLDQINDQWAPGVTTPVGDNLLVQGWAAVSISDGLAPDLTQLTLKGIPDGPKMTADARLISRDDVNRFFGKPQMGKVGYFAKVDLSGLHGPYLLGLNLTAGDKRVQCDLAKTIDIE